MCNMVTVTFLTDHFQRMENDCWQFEGCCCARWIQNGKVVRRKPKEQSPLKIIIYLNRMNLEEPCSQARLYPSPVNDETLQVAIPESSLLHSIQDQHFYIAITSLALRLARDAGASATILDPLAQYFLTAKGLQNLQFLNLTENKIGPSNEAYAPWLRGCSAQGQTKLLQSLQKTFSTERENEFHYRALKSYVAGKMREVAPNLQEEPIDRKQRFLKLKKNKERGHSINSANLSQNGLTCIVKSVSNSCNESYALLSRFVALKTMFGHAFEDDIEAYSPVYNVIFDRTGKILVTGGEEGLIKVWSCQTGELITNLKGHQEFINKLQISACNKYLWSSAGDGIRFFELSTLSFLTGWKAADIVDITIVKLRMGHSHCEFIFCDNQHLYLLEESIMVLRGRSSQALKKSDFAAFSFASIIKEKVKVNIIDSSSDYAFILLGFENGKILVIRGTDLLPGLLEKEFPKDLPCLRVIEEHEKEILEVKWSPDNCHFVTGGKEGACLLWDFSDGQCKKLERIQAGGRRKKKFFACNFIVWNCTGTHIAAGFHETAQAEDEQCTGDIIVYSLALKAKTCEFSKDVSMEIQAVNAMDAHPHFANIILVCESSGKVIIFDIFLNTIINLFEERGYHLLYPQFTLTPGDCRFSDDGCSFAVTSQMGSVTLYGYNIKDFYKLVPTEQFLVNDFSAFSVDEATLRVYPELPSVRSGGIQNIRGQIYGNQPALNKLEWLSFVFTETNPLEHENSPEVDKEYLKRVHHNLQESGKAENSYINTIEEIDNFKQSILLKERERQASVLKNLLDAKMKDFRVYSGRTEPVKLTPQARKLKRHAEIHLNYNQIDSEDSLKDNQKEASQVSAQLSLDSENQRDEQYSDSIGIRRPRLSYTRGVREQYNSQEQNRGIRRYHTRRRHSNLVEMEIENDSEQRVTRNRIRRRDDGEVRKKVKPNIEEEVIEVQEDPCVRCSSLAAQRRCHNCDYDQQFCTRCSQFRGKQFQQHYRCFICLFLENKRESCYSQLNEDHYRQDKRTNSLFVPQIDDRVRFFFQGYQEFLGSHVKKLSTDPVESVKGFRLLPHCQDSRLLDTPLCQVVDVQYYFPLNSGSPYQISGNRRQPVTEKNYLYMFLTLKIIEQGHEELFWLFYLPGSDFLLREEQFTKIKSTADASKIILIHHDHEELQIVDQSPFENIFPESLWKTIITRKTEGKRLRGNTKEVEKRINLWKIQELRLEDDEAIPFISEVPIKQAQFLISIIRNSLQTNTEYLVFEDFVDLQIYDTYRFKVQVGICLNLICSRLSNGYYRSIASFLQDLHLLESNSVKFNGESHSVTQFAHSLVSSLKAVLSNDSGSRREKRLIRHDEVILATTPKENGGARIGTRRLRNEESWEIDNEEYMRHTQRGRQQLSKENAQCRRMTRSRVEKG